MNLEIGIFVVHSFSFSDQNIFNNNPLISFYTMFEFSGLILAPGQMNLRASIAPSQFVRQTTAIPTASNLIQDLLQFNDLSIQLIGICQPVG
jgi:hypothetical protein